MGELLQALRGAKVIARGMCDGSLVTHYLLPDGRVLEVVTKIT